MFVGSPLIANIYERVSKQYIDETKKLGRIPNDYKIEFKVESPTGRVLKKRIDALSKNAIEALTENNSINDYLKILISPMEYSNHEFNLFKQYFLDQAKNNPK